LRANQKSRISDDGIGLSAVHIADAIGANVVAVDLTDEKLAKAEELGAEATVNAAETENVPRAVTGPTDGGAHVSVDALGIAETCRDSVGSLYRRGQHVQIGLTSGEEQGTVSLPTDAMVVQEIDFLGSFGMQPPRYDEMFRMVEAGSLDPSAVVSETVTLDDVPDRLAAMSDFETMGIPVVDEF
jgi:D-arabinose 1-dehydrogenase-like Zn-dependent alcohol dehydrogenase